MAYEQSNGSEEISAIDRDGEKELAPRRREESAPLDLVALALRSALVTLVVAVLCFGCFITAFPYSAMRMYSRLDMKDMALWAAERYMSRNEREYDNMTSDEGKYADALYLAVNNSVYLMNEAAEKNGYDSAESLTYARKADNYVNKYLDKGAMSLRSARVDSYNLLHTIPQLHPHVYSYAQTLEETRFKLWRILQKNARSEEERAKYASAIQVRVSTATTGWNESSGEWTPDENEMDEVMVFLSQLSAYIETELEYLESRFKYEHIETVSGVSTTQTLSLDEALAKVSLLNANRIKVDLYGYKPFALFVDEKGEFTGLYNDISYRFDTIVSVIRSNATKYTRDEGNDRAAHLKYTYYLKIMKDFSLDMANMTAVLSAGRGFYPESAQSGLQASYSNSSTGYESRYQVSNVRITLDGVKSTARRSMSDWYRYGMLYDYLDFWRLTNSAA